ncbi:sulfur carrier protein ThiS [Sulfobacillus thermosulfidooxidans]|uniref:sulfur carrier protein ThiS n=1 Tax=Sulfobacillus thermosulfidooxidans TaxID=28034 RepID=UPI00096BBD86|nr:sulfur carrier protein ThiS [Sulfobacillus thermosulfidooxidans]OLZ08142.1 thiamine biosynthesis protein ThiS [Sulfobacillus thermosulfidooxidans]OLZ14998.1 thiamine biosynthesis protein ThiS [Sulfobacillus thermosulfidooxidans]OLZ19643.1 thiamine biosynthesis protein ThiS [Sulfobacillus thermosulfidooxidans]
MRLIINGEPRDLPNVRTVKEMLDVLGVDHQTVAVMVNGEIIGRTDFDQAQVQESNTVEIVRFVGGG